MITKREEQGKEELEQGEEQGKKEVGQGQCEEQLSLDILSQNIIVYCSMMISMYIMEFL
jgi:hypothetical protein